MWACECHTECPSHFSEHGLGSQQKEGSSPWATLLESFTQAGRPVFPQLRSSIHAQTEWVFSTFLLAHFPYTHRLTGRQMKPFKYLLILSSVLIRPCNSCHAPHVILKHNVINTSSALMDASHMSALMKCVIVFPHRTLTISLTLSPQSPAVLLKTTSYQMNPQLRLSKFKFKFITEVSLMWREDTSLWGLLGPTSITIKRNRRQ